MPSPAEVQGMQVTVTTTLFGSTMQNVFNYHSESIGAYTSPANVADEWEASILPVWYPLLNENAIIIGLNVEAFAAAGVPPFAPAIRFPNLTGTVAGNGLQPYASLRMYKTPDLDEMFPDEPPTPWRLGMTRIGGLSEADQENGFLLSGVITDWNALADLLPSFSVTGFDYRMHMTRFQGGSYYWVSISIMETGGVLGTQNSRKYST